VSAMGGNKMTSLRTTFVRALLRVVGIAALAAITAPFLRADSISIEVEAITTLSGSTLGYEDLFSSNPVAVIEASETNQGVDSFGRTYSASAMVLGNSGGFALYASSSLSQGVGSG
jgi:hypothetical protein